MNHIQVLSTEAANSKGFLILNGGIDWTMYLLNPILLHEHKWSEKPIGRVENIHLENGKWIGTLVFDDSEQAKTLECEYLAHLITGVSVGGVVKQWGQTREDGVKVAASFQVFEISLVCEPSNSEARRRVRASREN